MDNQQKPKKYWYSWKGNQMLPIPTAKEGWYFLAFFILVLPAAALIFLPLKGSGNPTKSQLTRFIVVVALDVIVYWVVVLSKKEPKPPK